MRLKVSRVAIAAALMVAAGQPVQAAVLTFDDLSGTNFFLSNYNGFQFGTNNIANTAFFYTNVKSQYYTPVSGSTYVATDFQLYDNNNPYQSTQPISNSTAFIFNGAYFSGGDSIGYQLRRNGSLVYTTLPSAPLTSTPMFVASGYTGLVNEVIIFGRQGFYAFDNFTYNEVATTQPSVPEPASWAMMIVGFGLIGASLRRRVQVNFT